MSTYTVTIDLNVYDPEHLFRAALARALVEDPDAEALHQLRAGEGNREVDISACLIMLLDPGTLPGVEIYQSTAECTLND